MWLRGCRHRRKAAEPRGPSTGFSCANQETGGSTAQGRNKIRVSVGDLMEVAHMKVAIIGAGNVGGALSKSFSRAGHSVIIADRDPEEAQRMGSAVGGSGTADVAQAVAQSEVVVLAVPFAASGEQVCKDIAAQI